MKLHALTDAERSSLGLESKAGLVIRSVDPGSFAEDIGLFEKDVILAVNRQPVASVEDVLKIQNTLKPGDAVAFHVMRPSAGGPRSRPAMDQSLPVWHFAVKVAHVLYGRCGDPPHNCSFHTDVHANVAQVPDLHERASFGNRFLVCGDQGVRPTNSLRCPNFGAWRFRLPNNRFLTSSSTIGPLSAGSAFDLCGCD